MIARVGRPASSPGASLHENHHPHAGPAPPPGCVLAGRQLPVGRPDLSLRQSPPPPAAGARRREALPPAAGPLGHRDAEPEFHLHAPPEPGHPEVRPGHDLRLRPRHTAGRRWWATPTSRARYKEEILSRRNQPGPRLGLQRLFRQFSFPGGIPSHASPECPGSIHEGGELGYSLSHSFGAVFDNPKLIVGCVVGDGEAETGPLATAWHSNKFIDPVTDGAVPADPCISMDTRFPIRQFSPASRMRSWSNSFTATAGPLTSSRATSRS